MFGSIFPYLIIFLTLASALIFIFYMKKSNKKLRVSSIDFLMLQEKKVRLKKNNLSFIISLILALILLFFICFVNFQFSWINNFFDKSTTTIIIDNKFTMSAFLNSSKKTTRLDFAKNKAKEIISQKKIGHTFFISTTNYIDNKPKKFNSNKAAIEFVDNINVSKSFYEFDAYRIPNNLDTSQVIFISDGLLHDINLKNYLFINVPLNTKNISLIDVNQEEKKLFVRTNNNLDENSTAKLSLSNLNGEILKSKDVAINENSLQIHTIGIKDINNQPLIIKIDSLNDFFKEDNFFYLAEENLINIVYNENLSFIKRALDSKNYNFVNKKNSYNQELLTIDFLTNHDSKKSYLNPTIIFKNNDNNFANDKKNKLIVSQEFSKSLELNDLFVVGKEIKCPPDTIPIFIDVNNNCFGYFDKLNNYVYFNFDFENSNIHLKSAFPNFIEELIDLFLNINSLGVSSEIQSLTEGNFSKKRDSFHFEPGIYKDTKNNYIFSVNLNYTDINHSNYQIQPEKNKFPIQVLNSNYLMIIAAIIFLLLYLIDWSIYLKKSVQS